MIDIEGNSPPGIICGPKAGMLRYGPSFSLKYLLDARKKVCPQFWEKVLE
jgi:hypothetical protein